MNPSIDDKGYESDSTIATDLEYKYMNQLRHYKVKIRQQFLFMKVALETLAPEASVASLNELLLISSRTPALTPFKKYFSSIVDYRMRLHGEPLLVEIPGDIGEFGVDENLYRETSYEDPIDLTE